MDAFHEALAASGELVRPCSEWAVAYLGAVAACVVLVPLLGALGVA